MNKPLVSVFIPYYNDKEFLRDSIESVLNQTYKNFELILLNHASTDGSRDLAHSYNDARILHIDMDKNLGAGSTVLMEEYLKIANGKYAKLFCADDIMLPNCIEILVNYLETQPNLDIVYADMEYVNKKKKSLKTTWSKERPKFNFEYNEIETLKNLFAGYGFIPYPSSIVKMDLLKSIKKDPTFIMLVDMDIWARAIINGAKIKFVRDIVALYRIHEQQTASSANKIRVQTRSYFESLKYIEAFYTIKNLDMLKVLCTDVPFINDLKPEDEQFFPFVIAYNNLKKYNGVNPYKTSAYFLVHKLLSDERTSKELQDRFGFGIKEFRELYSQTPKKADIPIKELGICKLLFLLLRKIWKRITLQDLYKKRYTE